MTNLPDPESSPEPLPEALEINSPEYLALRQKVIRQRNLALALVLAFFAVLFFAITIVKMKV